VVDKKLDRLRANWGLYADDDNTLQVVESDSSHEIFAAFMRVCTVGA
jgi:hypothetical protein